MMNHLYYPRLHAAAGAGRFKVETGQNLEQLLDSHTITMDQAEELLNNIHSLSAATTYRGYVDSSRNCRLMNYISTILQSIPLPETGLYCNFSKDLAFVNRR